MPYSQFVLVIDSAPAQGALIASGCRGLGFQSDHVSDLRNLQSIVTHIRPVAIITQMKMHDHDGLDVMRVVSFVDKGIHILVTGFHIEKFALVIRAVQNLYRLQHVCVLPKPIWSAGLAGFLDAVVVPALS